MHRNPLAAAALLGLLALPVEADAVCTAGNPNANLIESTPTSAFIDHGLRGAALVQGVVGVGAKRSAAEIEMFIRSDPAVVAGRRQGYAACSTTFACSSAIVLSSSFISA